MDQIDTRLYHDFKINKRYFNNDFIVNIVNDMIATCDELFINKYEQLRKTFIPLCLESHDRYCFNILRIITLLYHFYIQYEIYHMAHKKP